MRLLGVCLSACVLSLISFACKSQTDLSQLSDYAPGKTSYTAQITNGTVYYLHHTAGQSQGGFGDFDSFQGPGDSYGSNGFNLVDENNQGSNQPAKAVTKEEVLKDIRAIFSQPDAKKASPNNSSENNSNFNNDDQYGNFGQTYTQKETIIQTIKYSVSNQLQFALQGLAGKDVGISLQKMTVSNVRVAASQPDIGIAGLKNAHQYVQIEYSARVNILVPKGKSTSTVIPWVPKSDAPFVFEKIAKDYRSCVEDKFTNNRQQHDISQLYYYFHPTKCNFSALNAQHKIFQRTQFQFKKATSAVKGGGQPEYDKIWNDGKLVATFVFGKYEAEGKNDSGTKAFQDFVNSLKSMRALGQADVKINQKNHYRAVYRLNTGGRKALWADIQAVHVSDIAKIDYEIGQLVFGSRIGEQDVFMYNGHSGYGNNINHIEKIIRPKDNKYVLFYLNGCSTYAYTQLEKQNYDVISNMKPSYFANMAESSYVMLDSLLKKQNYESILQRMPKRQSAIVSGEDQFCRR